MHDKASTRPPRCVCNRKQTPTRPKVGTDKKPPRRPYLLKYGQNTAKRGKLRPFPFVLSLILNTIRNGQNTAKTKRRAACLFSVRFFNFGRMLLLPYGGRG